VPAQVADGRRLVIVGAGGRAAVAYECFSRDSPHEVTAFSVEAKYLNVATHCGMPVVPLEDVARIYPPTEYLAFVAVSPSGLNQTRRQLYETANSIGYSFVSYVSSRAFVSQNTSIGTNTFIHAFVALQHGVQVGDNAVIESGTCVGHSTLVEDHCFISQHVAISGFCRIGGGALLGANSCIADNINIAANCELSPGAVILKDTLKDHIYAGNPARPIHLTS
jgi:sugar O-acyltransferase (sialic acid O-acetyltransferase NeuD family)